VKARCDSRSSKRRKRGHAGSISLFVIIPSDGNSVKLFKWRMGFVHAAAVHVLQVQAIYFSLYATRAIFLSAVPKSNQKGVQNPLILLGWEL